jgi:saccharopine dehydrogenase-like NADP-dependent oxidoreductase
MKKILLFGAGKSATALIDYLLENSLNENWFLTVVDADEKLAKRKIKDSLAAKASSFDVRNESVLSKNIAEADIVISLLPPTLHFLIAKACIVNKKNLLTASYVDEQMKSLEKDINAKRLLFLCELGLDPGIDHMSAKKIIDELVEKGATINSFMSHCGGLVAPESDDNPWHYKISWNPRNIVMAGKDGAVYKINGSVENLTYKKLFAEKRFVEVDNEILCWYPNRDSIKYVDIYELKDCSTFIRTTLRHPDFIYGWKNVIDLKLTDENSFYDTDNKSLMEFFKEHMDKNNFSDWLHKKLHDQLELSRKLLQDLMQLTEAEQEAEEKGVEAVEEFMVVSEEGDLQNIDLDELKLNAAGTVAERMHEANLTLKQLFFLGMDDEETIINKGKCTAADVLQLALERKLPLKESDKDMIVMQHEIEYSLEGKEYKLISLLKLKGDDKYTAMATTVGLPLGVATKLILNGTINTSGLQIPIIKELYEPILSELEQHDITFSNTITEK